MQCGLFVAHENVLEISLTVKGVVERKHGAAGITEHMFDAFPMKRFNHHLSAGEALGGGVGSLHAGLHSDWRSFLYG